VHLVVLNQFYWPSVAATAQLLTDLCEHAARAGHRVTVVASQGDYVGDGERMPAREVHEGVEIRRVAATSFGKGQTLGRLADYASFYALAEAELLRVGSPDVFLCLSTPPLIALGGLAAARARRARFVYWCQDVYPDVAVALGAIEEGGLVARALDDASRQVLERADAVVAIGERMAEVLSGRGAERLEVIHNWADGAQIDPTRGPARETNPFRREAGVSPNETLVLYAGNMGRAHEFGAAYEAIRWMATPAAAGLRLVFVGEGARKAGLEQAARDAGALGERVSFLPYQPRERLGEMLTAADAHLICLDPAASGLVVPSKLYGALASGRPTVLAGPRDSETATILESAQAGTRVDALDGSGLVNVFVQLRDEADARQRTGARAREVFEARFDAAAACSRFLSVLESGRAGPEVRRSGQEAWSPSVLPS
jgi:glycosyltransferase involved in cell wall biosynthesis